MESLKNIKKGLEFGFGILLMLGLVFGIAYAVGFHSADEILDGAFEGNYDFTGNVNFTSASVEGISGVPSGAIMSFYLVNCPTGWSPADGTNSTPDLRGQFLRGLNDFGTGVRVDGNEDSDVRVLGTFQENENKLHGHDLNGSILTTSSTGLHSHTSYIWSNSGGSTNRYAPTTGKMTAQRYTGEAGTHSHTIDTSSMSINESGEVQSRPNNVAVIYCVKE